MHGKYNFQFKRQRNITICLIYDPVSNQVFAGASCPSRDDPFDEDIGRTIAQGRAMNDMAEFYAKNAYRQVF